MIVVCVHVTLRKSCQLLEFSFIVWRILLSLTILLSINALFNFAFCSRAFNLPFFTTLSITLLFQICKLCLLLQRCNSWCLAKCLVQAGLPKWWREISLSSSDSYPASPQPVPRRCTSDWVPDISRHIAMPQVGTWKKDLGLLWWGENDWVTGLCSNNIIFARVLKK